jgi:hypothetical protein
MVRAAAVIVAMVRLLSVALSGALTRNSLWSGRTVWDDTATLRLFETARAIFWMST